VYQQLIMVMGTMKDSSRITNQMDKVCTSYFLFFALFFMLCFIGQYFSNDGNRYEGEYKDGKFHGQGKNEVFFFMIYWI